MDHWLEQTLETRDVWFAPLEEIVAHVQNLVDAGTYDPRTDQLPYYPVQVRVAS